MVENCVGSGKSLVIYLTIRYLLKKYPNKKILIIVPTINLVNQLFSDFSKDYGWNDAKDYSNILYNKTAKIFNKSLPILISTYHSLVKKPLEFFEDYIGVIYDEAQKAKSITNKTILEKCVNAEYRIGTSGTLPKERLDLMTIIGYLGPKLCSVKIKEMIDKGVLSQIKIANLILKYSEKDLETLKAKTKIYASCSCGLYKEDYYLNEKDSKPKNCPECREKLKFKTKIDYNDEIKFIEQNQDRNKIFKYIIKNATKNTENILILVDHLKHIESIKGYVENEFKYRKVIVINGSIDADVREEIRQQMIKDGGFILIATYQTVQLGINIPRLHHVILGSSGSSEIKIIQSIGRGLRTHESKDKLILWDIVDDLRIENKKSKKLHDNFVYIQHQNRLGYYNEQGFSCLNKIVELEKI